MPIFARTPSRLAAALALFAMPAAAFAQGTQEQQQACAPDAVKLCSDTIPDVAKTTVCMKAHFAQLTPRCQSAFDAATGGSATHAASRSRGEHHTAERETGTTAPEETAPPRTPGFPPFPSVETPSVEVDPPESARHQIARACREGLIDSYTCRTTVPSLFGAD